ncbi:hypothetical protein [uncultured Schumannella sp.]|uniref:hypothetical protein n=1 Tax=uncultured Schumannella sp. TaxID=1195956 RepID=UPI0025FA0CCA|nr:hypothetical protein [uncultured Schumannella sp.]
MPDFGPFSVEPAQVAALGGANFGQFVSRLLATEVAAHGMAGETLETTYLENVGDGGVDAGVRHAIPTRWIPAGESAWQFKAGDLTPAKCKAELKGATWAAEILRNGGKYRLVLGASLTSAKLAARRAKLIEAATELGIADPESKIEIVAADRLAGWIEEYPALAVSPLLRGTGVIGQTLDEWSRSNRHATSWVSSDDRDNKIEAIRNLVSGSDPLDLHLDGVSGLGKTRLVLEALRGQDCEPLVVYSLAADSFPVTVLSQLQSQGRTAIVVVDECDGKQHEIYASALATGSSIRLITVGEPGGIATRTPMINLGAFGDEAMKELLRANRPQLWPEAERVVVEVAAGNIDYALKLAQALLERGPGSAGTLVTDDDIRAFFRAQLPDGQLFLASCALALFTRFGHDGEVSTEIDTIAAGLGLAPADLRGAAAALQRQGLLSKQGRFRAVSPHPLALYLAAQAWAQLGHEIVAVLLPMLDPELSERLFRRAAEIGELESDSPAITAVLAASGPLASLESLAADRNSALLIHFAILAPGAVSERLSELISQASGDELRGRSAIRRDLVWALEKLAWHSRTFAQAADSLLALAVEENETYSNNATGTWVEFFGTMLPGTAASPDSRIAYLSSSATSPSSRVRLLVAKAAGRALEIQESIMVSGEVQGGVVVEPRGRPATYGDAWAYRNSAIDILAELARDGDAEVADAAQKELVDSIHGLLEIRSNREHLGSVLAGLPETAISRVRVEIEGLKSLFDRADVTDGRPAALESLEALLPEETPAARLKVICNTHSWDRQVDDLASEIAALARRVNALEPADPLRHLLDQDSEIPAAYAIGRALVSLGIEYEAGIEIVGPLADSIHSEALYGFLHGRVLAGEESAFDTFLDGADLPALSTLRASVRGPRTSEAEERVQRLVQEVPVAQGTRLLFAWTRDATEAERARYVREWATRLGDQADYNALVDYAAMQVFRENEPLEELDPVVAELVSRRREFPAVGQEEWDWTMLARRQLATNAVGLGALLADLIEADALTAYSSSEEAKLMQDVVEVGGEPVWVDLMNRLERGEWRLSFSVRDWLGDAVPLEVARNWVGGSVDRARVLADVTKPGGSTLAPAARFLIEEFGTDERVPSHLVGQFYSGMWSGNESDRIARQISEVESWVDEPGQSAAVKSWARRLAQNLAARRREVLHREEEDDRY